MISADIKTDVKQEKKVLVSVSYKFLWLPSQFEIEHKKCVYFPIQLDYVH